MTELEHARYQELRALKQPTHVEMVERWRLSLRSGDRRWLPGEVRVGRPGTDQQGIHLNGVPSSGDWRPLP